ncbi:MAG: hypothetical protein RLZZ215_1375 [Pseudomonadota bacterium]|jgi:exonuclease SbcC
MKILAIRGKNLASLARPFEIEFTSEPLASTGIFAITGPTGAGKSTLLDALCLALYDDMPRLPREGTRQQLPDVSGETIAPRDPRTILRRGAGEGFAEVDFVGNDGGVYRAHWSVRRARMKAEGRLQASEMSLIHLKDGQVIASTRKTEVLEAIVLRIGLSFEQFTRAVLLAQNEFASFLKAADDKRAELLQTLTGTDLFAELSRRAYQHAKEAEQSLGHLRTRLGSLAILSPEERQQQELASSQAQQQLQALETERLQLEQQLQWYRQASQLEQAYQQAKLSSDQAQAEEQAALERRQFLAQLEAVQVLSPVVEYRQRLQQEWTLSTAKLQDASQNHARAEQAQASAQTQWLNGQAQLATKQQAYAALQPDLLQVRQLDTLIQALLPRHAAALASQQSAQAALQALQAEAKQQARQLEQVQQQQTKLQAWLVAHRHWQELAEHWPHWQGLLQQAQASSAQKLALDSQLTALTAELAQLATRLASAELAWQHQQQVCTQAEAHYQHAQQQAACYDLTDLAQQRQQQEAELKQLQAAQQAWAALATTHQALLAEQAAWQQLQLAQQQSEQLGQQLQAKLCLVERDTERAEHAWRLAEAACADQATHWRVQLTAGDACPVCGALEHPYAQQAPALDAVLARLQEDYRQQRAAAKQLAGRVQAEQVHQQHYQQQRLRLEQSLLQAKAANKTALVKWQTYTDAGLSFASATELEQQLAIQQQALTRLYQTEQAAHHAYQQREIAQQAQYQAQQSAKAAQEQYLTKANQLKLQQTQQQYLQQSQAEWTTRLDSYLTQLDSAFLDLDWQDAWHTSASQFIERCTAEVHTWQAQQQIEQQLNQDYAELVAAQTAFDFKLQQAQLNWNTKQQDLAALTTELAAHQQERQGLLAGQSLVEFEESWQRELAQLTQQVAALQTKAEQARHAQIRTTAHLGQLQAQIQQLKDQQQLNQQTLATELAHLDQQGFKLEASELEPLLAYQPSWLQSERQALQALHTRFSQAQAILAERQAQQVQHEQSRPEAASLALVQAAYASQQLNVQAAQRTAQTLLLSLTADQQRREQAQSLQAELEQLTQQARIWGQLNELIGSANGHKFRDVAQQYSLDVLLSYANRHLADLSKRYSLRRVQRSLALLVLDQDMGGEIRSVHSLSGGESFLVSLALALGLASLSSQRVKVESLFIDEGFGSLDTDSLRIAMDALDQLQAQGRKVGVISHVQEMTERIAVQIQVRRLSGGQSQLRVLGN